MNIDDSIKTIYELKEINITHSELGEMNDFKEVEIGKDVILNFFENIINEIKLLNNIPEIVISQFFDVVDGTLQSIKSYFGQIENLINSGIYRPEYPVERKNIIKWFGGDHIFSNQKVINLIAYKDTEKFNSNYIFEEVSKKRKELNDELEKLKEIQSNTEKILTNIQDKISNKVVSEAISNFDKLEIHHNNFAKKWFFTFIIAMATLIIAFAFSIYLFPITDEPKLGEIIRNLFSKSFIILFPTIIAKISLTKYQTERHLKILYSHRSAVLSQFKEFENAIGDSVDAKNQFRLEIAKYLFSDPQTGLLKNTSNGDINVNPIVSIIEKIGLQKAS